jgi:hypothetical protein
MTAHGLVSKLVSLALKNQPQIVQQMGGMLSREKLAAYQSASTFVYGWLKQAVLEAIYAWLESEGVDRPADEPDGEHKTSPKDRMDAKLSSGELFKVLCLLGFARANATRSGVANIYLTRRGQPSFTVSEEDVANVRQDIAGQIDDVVGVLTEQYGAVALSNDIDIETTIRYGVLGSKRYSTGSAVLDDDVDKYVGTRTRKTAKKAPAAPKRKAAAGGTVARRGGTIPSVRTTIH